MTGLGADQPIVSVVVPTFNRAELLARLAERLTQQVGIDAYEILFVDDASTDDTAAVLERLASASPVPMRVLRTAASTSNPAGPRNVGWRAARSPVVAFIDDDCVPQPNWLSELVKAIAHADVVQGLTDADPAEAPSSGPFARFIVVKEFSWKFETCNIAYRRETLELLGGFDEGFPMKFGEDIDLGWRATAAHARLAFSPEAVVFHRVERTGRRVTDWHNWLRYTRNCEGVALTVSKHPGIRRHLYARYFYQPYHPVTLIALLGLAIAPRGRSWAAILLLPWIYYRTRVAPRPAPAKWLWAVLPMGFVVDAAEVLATLRGAAKYRTLVA